MAVNPDLDLTVAPTRRGRVEGFRIENYQLEDGQEATYTSAYFVTNPNVGPTVRIPRSPPGETLETLIGAILGAGQNVIDVGLALRYIWLCFDRIKGRLDEEWVTHGVVVGAEVTPRNLLNYVEVEEGEPYAGGNPGNAGQWLRALALVLSPIRLNSQLRREYLDALTGRYKATLEEFAGMRINDSPGTFALQHAAWNQNTIFLRLSAALDMFLFKFKDHEHSKLRFSTVTCRFGDCAGIGDLRFILKILGLNLTEFSQWIWTASTADDLKRLLRPNEEIDKRDSFTPYIASMRLCSKSPYSATANPNLHIFVHAIGCANLRARSINSRMVGDVNMPDTVANAAVLNYVRGSRYNLQPEFYRQGSFKAPEGARAALEVQSAAGSLDLE